ncbi:MAG: serine/threonine-protein kinase [Gammaproteobacteria bacterium]
MPVKVKGYREALQTGYELLWYRVQGVLGQGTFGITYVCEDLNTGRLVAVKEYLPPQVARREADHCLQPLSDALADDYARGLARFIAEAENLDRFRHPHIVRVVDIFEANNTAYLIMHYEHGESLQSALARRGTLSEGELRKLLFPLLEGLQTMHQKGFVHRDIKPSNLFVRADGTAVILDFGSARQLIVSDPQTVTNLVSPGYAPIEQYSSSGGNQGPWTDIYGLGATLYRAATGVIPQPAMARAEAIVHGGPDPFLRAVGHANGKYSIPFLRAIDQALEFKAGDRPQSVDAWRCAFEACDPAEDLPGLAKSTAMDESPTVPTEPDTLPSELRLMPDAMPLAERQQNAHPPGASGALYRWRRRRTAIEFLRAAAVILAGIGSIWLLAPTPIDQAPALASLTSQTSHPSQSPATVKPSSRAALNVDPTAVEQPLPDEINADLLQVLAQPGARNARPAQPNNATEAGPSVATLLALAGNDVAAYRLTTPQGNNALARYREVLQVDPENQEAVRGLRALVAKYVEMAYRQISRNHYAEAALYIYRASDIAPNAPSIRQARDLLDAARKIEKARGGSPARRRLTQIDRGAGPRNTGQPDARFEDSRRRGEPDL